MVTFGPKIKMASQSNDWLKNLILNSRIARFVLRDLHSFGKFLWNKDGIRIEYDGRSWECCRLFYFIKINTLVSQLSQFHNFIPFPPNYLFYFSIQIFLRISNDFLEFVSKISTLIDPPPNDRDEILKKQTGHFMKQSACDRYSWG